MFKFVSWLTPSQPPPKGSIRIRLRNQGVLFTHPFLRGQEGEAPPETGTGCRLQGDVMVSLGSSLRFKGLRLVIRGYYVMDMGPGRKGEADVFYETEVYPRMEEDWKEPLDGRLRCEVDFSFTADIPATDDTSENRVCYVLMAQALGDNPPPTTHPRYLTLPPPDPANVRDNGGKIPTIETTISAFVPFQIVHGEGNAPYATLDDNTNAFDEGIGIVQMRCTADVFSIGSPLHLSVSVPDFAPEVEIKSLAFSILQKQTLTSPRDQSVLPSTKSFPVASTTPDAPKREWAWQTTARLPSAGALRPSTLKQVDTPIKLEHWLVYELVYHYDNQKKTMRRTKPVTLPSCLMIPENVDVPLYDAPEETDDPQGPAHIPCEACGRIPIDNLCEDTPATSLIRHVKHDDTNDCQLCRFKEIDLDVDTDPAPGTKVIDHSSPHGFKCACKLRDMDDDKKFVFHETSDPNVGLSYKLKAEDAAIDKAQGGPSGDPG